MKKRIRLFATVASIFLILAITAFGVYSALQPTATFGGTLVFEEVPYEGTWAWEIKIFDDFINQEPDSSATETEKASMITKSGNENDCENLVTTIHQPGKYTILLKVSFTSENNKRIELSGEKLNTTSATINVFGLTSSRIDSAEETATTVAFLQFEVPEGEKEFSANYELKFTLTEYEYQE